jgi:hypothetical protein
MNVTAAVTVVLLLLAAGCAAYCTVTLRRLLRLRAVGQMVQRAPAAGPLQPGRRVKLSGVARTQRHPYRTPLGKNDAAWWYVHVKDTCNRTWDYEPGEPLLVQTTTGALVDVTAVEAAFHADECVTYQAHHDPFHFPFAQYHRRGPGHRPHARLTLQEWHVDDGDDVFVVGDVERRAGQTVLTSAAQPLLVSRGTEATLAQRFAVNADRMAFTVMLTASAAAGFVAWAALLNTLP